MSPSFDDGRREDKRVMSGGTVALTGLNGNNIVGTLQCRIFKRPADTTERKKPIDIIL